MKIQEFNFVDQSRARLVPVCVYLPEKMIENCKIVVFNPGYQDKADRAAGAVMQYKNYIYLAEYFTGKGYVFLSIQHDLDEDNDGLETIDPNALQAEVRKHLWERGQENIIYAISELCKLLPNCDFNNFIIAGHSNGGDMAKFFANNFPDKISEAIIFDGRRCPLKPCVNLRVLMFEANDTSTDIGVIPDQGLEHNPKRINLEWVVIKPRNALHSLYTDSIKDDVKLYVYSAMDWFLNIPHMERFIQKLKGTL